MMKLALLWGMVLLGTSSELSSETTDTFIIEFQEQKLKVWSPKIWDPHLTLIVKNQTPIKLLGRLETDKGQILAYTSVNPRKSQSLEIGNFKNKKIFFIPLMPANQKIELQLGKNFYEIPPREKK